MLIALMKITFETYPNDASLAVISGGTLTKGWATTGTSNVWKYQLSSTAHAPKQLWVNGHRRPRARLPSQVFPSILLLCQLGSCLYVIHVLITFIDRILSVGELD
jgi:hypothetical protein